MYLKMTSIKCQTLKNTDEFQNIFSLQSYCENSTTRIPGIQKSKLAMKLQ